LSVAQSLDPIDLEPKKTPEKKTYVKKKSRTVMKPMGHETSASEQIKIGLAAEITPPPQKKKGVAVKTMGDETLRICRELVDEVVLCDTDEICVAIKDIFEDTRQIFF
jgi:threonine dehydratase